MQTPCHDLLVMPPDQRSHDPARAGLSPAQPGFWELDLRSWMLALSDTARAICSLGDFLQHAHPDDLQRVHGKVHAAVRAGTRRDVGFRIVRNAGDERHVRAR